MLINRLMSSIQMDTHVQPSQRTEHVCWMARLSTISTLIEGLYVYFQGYSSQVKHGFGLIGQATIPKITSMVAVLIVVQNVIVAEVAETEHIQINMATEGNNVRFGYF